MPADRPFEGVGGQDMSRMGEEGKIDLKNRDAEGRDLWAHGIIQCP